jgi:SAM-dependent methyltransferase
VTPGLVRPFWHPLSTILLNEPRCFAADGLLRMLLKTEGRVSLVYAGDRMWPGVRHGDGVSVLPLDGLPAAGSVVLVSRDGIPDLLRVAAADSHGVSLTADAAAEPALAVRAEDLIGLAELPHARPRRMRAAWRRLRLDLSEAWSEGPETDADPAGTVRDKYESQAGHYARVVGPQIDPRLLARIGERVPGGGSVLVVGSGAGRECFALAEAGFRVRGIEFSPAMVELSTREAAARELDVEFLCADVRRLEQDADTLDGVLFTYDVYSFLPLERARVDLLRRLRSWLRPAGVVFVSARRALSIYERLILVLQWLAHRRSGEWELGDSHTRWIPEDGGLRRSFVHVFSIDRLRAEGAAVGFRLEPWEDGHGVLTRNPAAIIRS